MAHEHVGASYTSLEWLAYRVTRDTIRKLADDGVLSAVGEDTIQSVAPQSVVGDMSPRRKQDRGNQGLPNIPLPAILISWLGHKRPETAGEVNSDDGIIQMLIQIVDRLDRTPGDTGYESYMCWLNDIREKLQSNPYRAMDCRHGDCYFVHVTDHIAQVNRDFILEEARLATQVSIYTRSRRSTEDVFHDA